MMTWVLLAALWCAQPARETDRVAARVADELPAAPLGDVRIGGFLGQRIDRNIAGRLKHAPMDELLDGFQHRPGKHPWIGEHLGKWLHAAVCAWQYSGDEELKDRIDRAVSSLLATQGEDGYLGTYKDQDRWGSWDVWAHKYNLIGLLTYYRATGNAAALQGARRMGDLLVNTFGPDKRDIIQAGAHKGMAATSVLEPMVFLYRATGDDRYLEFCRYLVQSWDQPDGPKLLTGLLGQGKVNKLPSPKAYEMLSNLLGLFELYRTTADEQYLKAVRAAWDDISHNQLRITGGSSWREVFWPDGYLPDTGDVAETCVTVTWLQLSMGLSALTGQTKYADAIEQVIYNHLLGAQAEDGNDWCTFTALAGIKILKNDVNCCHSSGPRGVALIPGTIYATAPGKLRINLYGESQFRGEIPGIGPVEIIQRTTYPMDGRIEIEVRPAKPAAFRLELRIPTWSRTWPLAVNGRPMEGAERPLAVIDRQWQMGDVVSLTLDVAPQWIRGTGDHAGTLTARKGPFVLCASARWNPDMPSARLIGVDEAASFSEPRGAPDRPPYENRLFTSVPAKVLTPDGLQEKQIVLGPFALVQKEKFATWLLSAESLSKVNPSSLCFGREDYSRKGYEYGSLDNGDFNDGNPRTYHVTKDGTYQNLDWWEVLVDRPVKIQHIVFRHGHAFPAGGWFDTSAGKPVVFVRTEKEGDWQRVGKLASYPETTADKQPKLANGQAFELTIEPVLVYGVRVAGKPACGNKPSQSFSSCAELSAEGEWDGH